MNEMTRQDSFLKKLSYAVKQSRGFFWITFMFILGCGVGVVAESNGTYGIIPFFSVVLLLISLYIVYWKYNNNR